MTFAPSTNTTDRLSIVGAVFLCLGLLSGAAVTRRGDLPNSDTEDPPVELVHSSQADTKHSFQEADRQAKQELPMRAVLQQVELKPNETQLTSESSSDVNHHQAVQDPSHHAEHPQAKIQPPSDTNEAKTPEPESLPRSRDVVVRDGQDQCDNRTIGRSKSCPSALLAGLYGYAGPSNPLFSRGKMWFARRLNQGVYVAGQLTARQIRYAADSGFKSIVTIFDQDGEKGPNNKTLVLSSAEEEQLSQLAGMKFFRVLKRGDDWFSLVAVERMNALYSQVELPALFHCKLGVSSTMLVLLHYAKESRLSPGFEPHVDSARFYEITRAHGLDFVEKFNMTIDTVKTTTGEEMPKSARKPNVSPPTWFNYWQAQPVGRNWFSAGQINRVELQTIKGVGFLTIVNVRQGLTHDGNPSQESVELVNIRSRTPTYSITGSPLRQSKGTLETLVLDSSKPQEYVCPNATTNYESENPDEFGDHIGYNEEEERTAMEEAGIDYVHLPLRSMDDFQEFMATHKETLLEVGRKGPVLIHCWIGYRAAVVGSLVSAIQHNLSLEWALQRLKEMGHGISEESDPQIYTVFTQYLATASRVEL